MANAWFWKGLQAIGSAGINFPSDTIKVGLWSTAYTPAIQTDQFFGIAVPGGAVIAAGVALTSVSLTGAGAVNAANTTWTSVSGSQASYIGGYKDTGTANTSPLLFLIDTATGLPVTPNGGNINAAWASGIIATLYEGLSPEEASIVSRLWRGLKDSLRFPLRQDPSGLWIPEQPQVTLG